MYRCNDLDTPTGQRQGKAYATMAAKYALVGVELIRSDPEISRQAPYYAAGRGLWKPLEDLDEARDYLVKLTKAGGNVQELQEQ